MLLPGNEPQFLDRPARTAAAIPTEIFQPAISRRKHKYGKVNFKRENAGFLEVDFLWHTGKLGPSSGTQVGGDRFRRHAGVIISARINGVTSSRKLNFKPIITAYLMNVTGQLTGGPSQKRSAVKNWETQRKITLLQYLCSRTTNWGILKTSTKCKVQGEVQRKIGVVPTLQ